MDGAPQKLTDVTFDECRRGYDPEQVDTYLEKVSQAVDQLKDLLRDALARAEGAEARLAQAKRAQNDAEGARSALEAELEAARADLAAAKSATAAAGPSLDKASSGAGGGSLDSDELAKVLLMAQRTADQTVNEAKQDAKKIVSDARSEATRLVVDAERQRDEVLKGARDEARELVEKEAAGLEDTVDRLEARREELQGDLSVLTKYVDEQRRQLAGALEKLRRVLEDPAEFRVAPAPVLKTAKPAPATPSGAAPSGAAPKPAPAAAPATAPAAAPASAPAAAPALGKPAESPRPTAPPKASVRAEPRAADRPSALSGSAALAVEDARPVPIMRAVPDLVEPDPEPVTAPEPAVAAAVAPVDDPVEVAPAAPVADPAAAVEGPATERYDVLANDTGEVAAVLAAGSSPLGELRPESTEPGEDDLFLELERAAGTSAHGDAILAASSDEDGSDEAIRAFFDADDDPGRRWFGRRR